MSASAFLAVLLAIGACDAPPAGPSGSVVVTEEVDPASGDGAVSAESPGVDPIAAARRLMTRVRYCALVTLDASGAPRVRTMDPFPPEPQLTVWLATRRGTRKLQDLAGDSRAALYYFDGEGPGYVTLRGDLRRVDDPEERQRWFKPEWADFYDEANRGDDYVLLRFDPERLEIVSIPDQLASAPKAWRPVIVELESP